MKQRLCLLILTVFMALPGQVLKSGAYGGLTNAFTLGGNHIPQVADVINLPELDQKRPKCVHAPPMQKHHAALRQQAAQDTEPMDAEMELELELELTDPVTGPVTEEPEPYNGFVGMDGDVPDNSRATVEARLTGVLPDGVIQAFLNSGWSIAVTDKNIALDYCDGVYGNSVMGLTFWDEHLILIEDREAAISEAPVHEFGHWLDSHLGFASSTEEFAAIWGLESGSFEAAFQYPYLYDYAELFAESFSRYFLEGDTLKASCPQLYGFLSNIMSDF